MGYDQLATGVPEHSHKFDGMLYAFARHDSGGLQDKDIVGFQADRLTRVLGVFIQLRRWLLEVENIRQEQGSNSFAQGKLFLGSLVYNCMA